MIGKYVLRLAVFLCPLLLGLSAGAVSTSKNVDIIVSHSGSITTYTFLNNGSTPLPPGFPVTIGQAFRRGDLLPGQYPLLRDGATHRNLVWQMDEANTRRENSDDKSLRHAVFSFQLPTTSSQYVGGVVPPGGTYQVEFLPQAGTYSASGVQPLSALCFGPGSHDLKVRLTDIRNQDDTVRDSGAGTFRICDNIANVGRDAPRHLWAGPVLDLYEVRGQLVYDTTGHKDPLLYFICDVYLTTQAGSTALGPVKWVCEVHHPWIEVAAGSVGLAGAPGPAGFPKDPQAISYRPSVLDGSNTILDWSALDATIDSSTNPVQTNCGQDYQGTIPACLKVPSSTGQNQWFYGQAVRVTNCTATCVGGLTNGRLLYVYNDGVQNLGDPTIVSFKPGPVLIQGAPQNPELLTSSQGTGLTTFEDRVYHTHNMMWVTVDPTGLDNWTSGTSRVTHDILPDLTVAEQTYWEETGTVMPLYLGQAPGVNLWLDETHNGTGIDSNYHAIGRNSVIGTAGAGKRPDLGLFNEWANQAFVKQDPASWALARVYSLSQGNYPGVDVLSELTGHIPPLNNGTPGPGGFGVGTPYSELGTPMPTLDGSSLPGLDNYPINGMSYCCGFWGSFGGTYISHEPAFTGYQYLMLGDRHYLDFIYQHQNRATLMIPPGPGEGSRFDKAGTANTYYGLFLNCCQTRGSEWAFRDKIFCASSGGDSNQERTYCNDTLTENYNYYQKFQIWKDGPGNSNWSNSILPPDRPGGAWSVETFIIEYGFYDAWLGTVIMHDPLAGVWLQQLARFEDSTCGEAAAGHPSAYYCIDYNFSPAIHNGDGPLNMAGGNVGPYMNGTDASDFGGMATTTNILTGGTLQIACSGCYPFANGDTIKWMNGVTQAGFLIDQLPGNQWFQITNVNSGAGTYQILCPAGHAVDATCPNPGTGPFVGFTRNGNPVVNETGEWVAYRMAFNPPTGYISSNYIQNGGQIMTGLYMLGLAPDALPIFRTRTGYPWTLSNTPYNASSEPSQWWDPTIVIP